MQFPELHFGSGLEMSKVRDQTFFYRGTLGSILSQKKFDFERSSYVGQINKAQNANLTIAF